MNSTVPTTCHLSRPDRGPVNDLREPFRGPSDNRCGDEKMGGMYPPVPAPSTVAGGGRSSVPSHDSAAKPSVRAAIFPVLAAILMHGPGLVARFVFEGFGWEYSKALFGAVIEGVFLLLLAIRVFHSGRDMHDDLRERYDCLHPSVARGYLAAGAVLALFSGGFVASAIAWDVNDSQEAVMLGHAEEPGATHSLLAEAFNFITAATFGGVAWMAVGCSSLGGVAWMAVGRSSLRTLLISELAFVVSILKNKSK